MHKHPSLATLPIEIIEDVADKVADYPRSLLSLALTSKDLAGYIISNHLKYCIVRCDLLRLDVWKSFIANPSLARRVRFLDIIDEQRLGTDVSPWPASTRVVCPIAYQFLSEDQFTGEVPWTEVEKYAKEVLFQAITKMTSLVSFSWNSSKPLDSHPNQSHIFTALRSNCPRLSDVRADFVFEDVIPSHLYYRQVDHPLWSLSNLTHFVFYERLRGSYPHAGIEIVRRRDLDNTIHQALSQNCPNLEYLQIRLHDGLVVMNGRLHFFLNQSQFPHLISLMLAPDCYRVSDMETFLNKHPTLENISLPRSQNLANRVELKYSGRLRSFRGNLYPTGMERREETLAQIQHLNIGDFDDVLFKLEYALGLETLQVSHKWEKLHFLRHLRKLERLRLDFSVRNEHIPRTISLIDEALDKCLPYLPNLTHIAGSTISLFFALYIDLQGNSQNINQALTDLGPEELQPAAYTLALKCPSLEFIELFNIQIDFTRNHHSIGRQRCLRIYRDHHGDPSGCEWVLWQRRLRSEEWSGFQFDTGGIIQRQDPQESW